MRVKILIVDHQDDRRRALESLLKSDFQVLTGSNYEDAAKIVEMEANLRAVATDLQLGNGPGGLDVLRHAQVRAPHALRVLMAQDADPISLGAAFRTQLVQRYARKLSGQAKLADAIRAFLRGE